MRLALGLCVCVLAACGGNPSTQTDCTDGEMRECYSGPDGTADVGPCKTGVEICSGGRWPGVCLGDVPPLVEQCNKFDDNCNGVIDDVAGTDESCTGTNGCEGARMCDDNGRVRCFAPSQNECDLCGGPEVIDLGDDCLANGCVGALVCTSDNRGSTCAAPTQNECGVCGGVPVPGLAVDCMSADSCPGTTVCDVDGAAAICDAPLKNECDACFPSVGAIGAACSGDRGCIGLTTCNGTGDVRVCTLDAPCAHIVISEIATGSGICNTDEFIELYNPSSRTVSLAGYTLRSRTASSGNYTRLVAFAADATIAPHGFFLVASSRSSTGCSNSPSPGGGYPAIPGNTVTANATYTAELSATIGAVFLTTIDQNPVAVTDEIVIDVLGWDNNVASGDSTLFEGTAPVLPHEAANPNGSIERKANATSTAVSMAAGGSDATAGNGRDSDDNLADFVAQAVRVPQNAASTAEP